jgi:tetraacyldisaccharide 4'-kinase
MRFTRRRFSGVRVISVGNISIGGTGKTPMVEFICRFLRENGHRVSVVTRGYRRFDGVGDEPQMLMRQLAGVDVKVDADRARAIRAAQAAGMDTVVLDDGFQQWHIAPDLDIVLVDAGCPFGNGRLLPRGILREQASALGRAAVIVVTKTNLTEPSAELLEKLARYAPDALLVHARHEASDICDARDCGRVLPVAFLSGRKVSVFSAIGDPDSFEALIRSCGGIVALSTRFPDHHPYSAADVDAVIARSASNHIATVVTTEKDAIRLGNLIPATCSVLVLRMRMTFGTNGQLFLDRLRQLYTL